MFENTYHKSLSTAALRANLEWLTLQNKLAAERKEAAATAMANIQHMLAGRD